MTSGRLQFVQQAKRLGFSLDEIKTILQMRERGMRPCDEVVAMAKRHLDEAEEQLSSLLSFRNELSRVLRQWKRSKARNVPGDTIYALIERTMDRSEGKKHRSAE